MLLIERARVYWGLDMAGKPGGRLSSGEIPWVRKCCKIVVMAVLKDGASQAGRRAGSDLCRPKITKYEAKLQIL